VGAKRHHRWLWQQIQADDRTVVDELHRIAHMARQGDVLLGCLCPPAPCHGEVVKVAVEWLIEKLARPVQVCDTVSFTNVLGAKRYGQVLAISEKSGLIEVQWSKPEERGWTYPPGDGRREGARLEVVEGDSQ
jgi:hypothetical protein